MFEKLKMSRLYDLVLPIHKIVEVILWKKRGETPPTPHLVKEAMVRKYADKYKCNVFIETGTYLGEMVNSQKNNFDKIYSVELNRKLFRLAKDKFKKFKHIMILQGDSVKILPKILSKIHEPTLFWLDAHYSGGITSKSRLETPIVFELRTILEHKIEKHVILINNENLFVLENKKKKKKNLKGLVSIYWPKNNFTKEHDIFVIKNYDKERVHV